MLWLSALNAAAVDAGSTVYIARRGWHIDIGLAAEDLSAPLASIAVHVPDTRYAFFGFGDKHYLLAAKHGPPVLFSALWQGAGVILLTGIANTPQDAFGGNRVVALKVTAAQMVALQSFIEHSFRSADVYHPGPYDGSAFFLASQKYSALHTCNTWGAEALKAAGLGAHAKGVIFASQLWAQAKRLERAQENPPSGLRD
jgi:hypothetical protein